ncbi:MAG: hypothetical protein HKN32_02305 [Flavobacteriales bacterium]|nr:hypothetical protein [Flavobacteriales bacterium]
MIEAHRSEPIFIGEKRGGDETPVGCTKYLQNVVVSLDSGVVLTKDILDENNWVYSASEKNLGGVVTQTCRFMVTDGDVE